MSKTVILFILVVFTLSICAQAPAIEWQKSLGGSQVDDVYCIVQTPDGGYALAGNTRSSDGDVTFVHGTGTTDFWIVKLDSTGALEWQKSLGGSGNEYVATIVNTIDGGYMVAGCSESSSGDVTGNHGGFDYWVVKLSNIGAIQWQRSYGSSADDFAWDIIQTSDGGYAISGCVNASDGDVTGGIGGEDIWIVKLNSGGNIEWQKCLGGTADDDAFSIVQTPDGGYALAGNSESNDGDVTGNHGVGTSDLWVIKLSSTGNLQWQKALGGSLEDLGQYIVLASDGGYVVCGYAKSSDGDVTGHHGAGTADYWIVKLSSTGTIVWTKCLGGSGEDIPLSNAVTVDGGYCVAGYSNSADGDVTGNQGDYDIWLTKLSSTGTLDWQKSLGGAGNDQARSIIQTPDRGYLVGGQADSSSGDVTGNHGSTDAWIVKLARATDIFEVNGNERFSIYPNPATDQLYIKSDGREPQQINIYNANGILINSVNEFAGSTIDVNFLACGVYIIEIREGETIVIKRWVRM